MFAEALGGCILVFIYLTQTEAKTRLANDPAITMIIISGAYIVACNMVRIPKLNPASPINPAITTGILAGQVLAGDYKYRWGWTMIVFPILGGILGLVLFECVYKKTSGAVKEGNSDVDDKEGAEQVFTGGAHYGDNPYAADQEPLIV